MVKSKKFGLADKVQNKKKVENKKINPFEVHINKVKSKVLGRNIKDERGIPGISRAKAVQKRKDTIAKELKVINKTNSIVDLRNRTKGIGNMQVHVAKKSKTIFNLADEEITHRGDTIDQLEKFVEPPLSDDEDGEGQFGGLDDKFVSEGHFAGGIVGEAKGGDSVKSRKDLIEQLIAESKKRKADKQKEKEENLDLTEKLDSEWKDLQPVVFKRARVEELAIDKLLSQTDNHSQDYDKMMRELKFEKRGTPSDALKSEEQQKKEEREKLQKLEEERKKRMFGEEDLEYEQQPTLKHRSADALDDNFDLDDNQEFMLAYDKDGKPLVPDHILQDYSVPNMRVDNKVGLADEKNETADSVDGESEEDSDDENEEDSDDENGECSDDQNENNSDDENSKENNEEIDDNGNTHYSESKRNSNVNDVSENDSLDETNGDNDLDNVEKEKERVEDKLDDLKDLRESDPESEEEIETVECSKKITCFFNIQNEEGENLKELLQEKSPEQQSNAIGKLIKSYDPGLNEKNKERLSRLFAHMLQYLNDVFTDLETEMDYVKAFKIYEKMGPYFYDLVQTNKVSTKSFYAELLKEKHEAFVKNRRKVPDMDTIIFFKLVSLLYPTSDHRHPIATPSLVFMGEILRLCSFRDMYSISRGLFIAAIIAEYTTLSKRYIPEVINFLRGIVYLAANTSIVNPIQLVPPFRLHKEKKILKLEDDCSNLEFELRMTSRELALKDIDNEFRIRSLVTCLRLLREFFDYFQDLEAQVCIFEPHLQLLGRIDFELYPKEAANTILDTIKYMKECFEVKVFRLLTNEKKRPKLLRMYEPEFQDVFTGTKNSKSERDKLKHKYKREVRGAMREIKRDAAFIAGLKIEKKIKSDNIRKEKVKQIYKEAGIQQAELNKLKRKT